MRTSTWPLRVLAGVAVTITALGLGACGSKGGGGNPAAAQTTNGDSYFGGAPSGSATPSSGGGSATTGTGNTGGGNGGSTAPTYPHDAKSYGLAFLQALGQHNTNRISALAVQSAVAQVNDGFYQNLNTQWSYRSCGPSPNEPADSNKTACVYDNANGDEITIVMNKNQLGFPTAVLEALLEKTTYPNDPGSYASELVFAYENGNLNRVVRLSSNTVKGELSCKLASQTTSVTLIDSSYSSVMINDGTAGHSYTFKVLTASGGKAGAVKDVISKMC